MHTRGKDRGDKRVGESEGSEIKHGNEPTAGGQSVGEVGGKDRQRGLPVEEGSSALRCLGQNRKKKGEKTRARRGSGKAEEKKKGVNCKKTVGWTL